MTLASMPLKGRPEQGIYDISSRKAPLQGDTRCVWRVPISGSYRPGLTGHVTGGASRPRAAARSEPHRVSGRWRGTPGTLCTPVRRRVVTRVYPGWYGVPWSTREARTIQGWTSAYTEHTVGQAGAGPVPGTVSGAVPEQGHN